MYIMINNIKGEKRIDLSYSIQNFDSSKEITVIRMLSDNVKYEILKLRAVMDLISDAKNMIPKGAYAGRELISMLVHVPNFEGVAGSEDFACATLPTTPLIFKEKYKIFVTLPS